MKYAKHMQSIYDLHNEPPLVLFHQKGLENI